MTMLSKLKKSILNNIFPIIIAIFVVVISIANFLPGTFLTGWDNVHAEFNLPLNIERGLSGVWQEYQGLGVLGGMAHSADLSREVLLLIASVILKTSLLRYFWVFSMLCIGPLGAYYLLVYLFKGNKYAAFLGAMFYLLNLATLQNFYTPYESFVSFYGFLPWFIFAALSYLQNNAAKNKTYLVLIFLVGSSAFYVQTLFVVLMIVIGIFSVEFFIKNPKSYKKILSMFLYIFISCAFWLLPVIYFTITNVSVVTNNHINSIATVETQYMNEGYGDLGHTLKLQGFWFSYVDAQNGKYDYLMDDWRTYTSSQVIEILMLIVSTLIVIGFAVNIFINRKLGMVYASTFIFVVALIMLSGGNGLFGTFFSTLGDKIPLFSQLFRASFTKWSIVAALFYSYGFASLVLVIEKIKVRNLSKTLSKLFILGCLVILILISKPFFDGKLISDNMRLSIPHEYFELFSYFKNEPQESRIAFMPMQNFWGWNFYDWGYRGSGFLWYGIKQPILDRAFDVWSQENESFYVETQRSIYSNDATTLKNVLTKYKVRYLVLDSSVILPETDNSALKLDALPELVNKAGWVKVWSSGKITVFSNQEIKDSFVYAPEKLTEASTISVKNAKDIIYENEGDYITGESAGYPLLNLLSKPLDSDYFKTDFFGGKELNLSFKANSNTTLIIPPLVNDFEITGNVLYKDNFIKISFNSPAQVSNTNKILDPIYIETKKTYKSLVVSLGGKNVTVDLGKSTYFSGVNVDPNKDMPIYIFDANESKKISIEDQFNDKLSKCWERPDTIGKFTSVINNNILNVKVKDVVACSSYKIGSFNSGKELLTISLPFMSDTKARPDFCLVEEGSSTCLHDEIFYSESTSKEWKNVIRDVFIDDNKTYWLVLSARPSDTKSEEWNINYKSPEITIKYAISTFNLNSKYWNVLEGDSRISVEKGSNINISIPLSELQVKYLESGRGGAYNCDLFKRGEADRIVENNNVIFSANNFATECDYKYLSELSTQKDYLLRIQGENQVGRSLKIYLWNENYKKNEIESLLGTHRFDNTFSLFADTNAVKNITPFTLNFETRSFREKSINKLSGVTLYQLPLTWLVNWKLEQANNSLNFEEHSVTSESKIGTWFYRFNINSNSNTNTAISLSQGYNSGWVAIRGFNIFNSKRFDSWANGWILPLNEGENTIFLVYLPQALEFVGLSSVVLIVFYIFLKKDKRRS